MANLFLKVAATPFDVRHFHVHEKVSQPFHIELEAVSPDADIDFEQLIGQSAQFRLAGPTGADRHWQGVCTSCEQTRGFAHSLYIPLASGGQRRLDQRDGIVPIDQ